MRRIHHTLVVCLLVALLSAGAQGLRAEVSAYEEEGVTYVLLLAEITEGPDPIPSAIWGPVRDVDPVFFLNTSGAGRGDGPPDIARHPDTGMPHVVWAYSTDGEGDEHDIAYSRWTGQRWTGTQFLTTDAELDERDPRIFIDETGIYVVWWESENHTLWLTSLLSGSSGWDPPEEILTPVDFASRPSVAHGGGPVLIAYENQGAQGAQILLATRQGPASYSSEIVVVTAESAQLNVLLHAEGGKLWMDWRASSSEYAYSEFVQGSWTSATAVPWADNSWIRQEEIRRIIRGLVLAP